MKTLGQIKILLLLSFLNIFIHYLLLQSSSSAVVKHYTWNCYILPHAGVSMFPGWHISPTGCSNSLSYITAFDAAALQWSQPFPHNNRGTVFTDHSPELFIVRNHAKSSSSVFQTYNPLALSNLGLIIRSASDVSQMPSVGGTPCCPQDNSSCWKVPP